MTTRRFSDWDFELLGRIETDSDGDGNPVELLPQDRYINAETSPLHAYGAGPFCRFRIARGRAQPGLYVLTVEDIPVYAGECIDVGKRWGPNGYGGISPRNCFDGGQPINCRVNAAILQQAKEGKLIELWFRVFNGSREDRLASETQLIHALQPAWNRAKRQWQA